MTGPFKLEDLPEAILHKIAQYVEPWERRTVLPLVSKAWARLLEGPSPAWEQISIERNQERQNMKVMEAWLSRRAGAVRNLRVSLSEDFWQWAGDAGEVFPASVLAAALGTDAHQLRVMHIETAAIAVSSADLNAVLGCTPNLEEMSLDFSHMSACWDDHGTALMQTLLRLPALQSLTISTKPLAKPARYKCPRVVELAALSSAQLTYLEMDIRTTSHYTLSLGDLPALTCCRLGGYGVAAVHLTASSLSGAPNLTAFASLTGYFHLAPDCFTNLSFLKDLRLTGCGLHMVPSALAGVKGTLRHLDLSNNNDLRVEALSYGILLSLSVLEWLDLSKVGADTAMVWDLRSVQYLTRFLTEWQALRPGVKLPTINIDIDSDDDDNDGWF